MIYRFTCPRCGATYDEKWPWANLNCGECMHNAAKIVLMEMEVTTDGPKVGDVDTDPETEG